MFQRFTPDETSHAVELYKRGLTINGVGREIGRPYQTVRSVLLRAGVTLRPRGYGRPDREAAAICNSPIGALPPGHCLRAVDRVALRDRARNRRLDIMRHSSGFPALFLAAALLAIAPTFAAAHTITLPNGEEFDYPGWCCHGGDCMRQPAAQMRISPSGELEFQRDGTWYAASAFERHYASPDMSYHVCIYNGKPRCLFGPPGI